MNLRVWLLIVCCMATLTTVAPGTGDASTSECKTWLGGWNGECLLSKVRHPDYFFVRSASDKQLQEYIRSNADGVAALLLQIDYARDLAKFLDGQGELVHELAFVDALHLVVVLKTIETIIDTMKAPHEAVTDAALAVTVVAESLAVLSKLREGIETYRRAARVYTKLSTKEALRAYFDSRIRGLDETRAWNEVNRVYEPLTRLVGETKGIKGEKLRLWFENAYAAYRLVGYSDSSRIRHAEGRVIGKLAARQLPEAGAEHAKRGLEVPPAAPSSRASVVPRFRVYIPLFLSVGASTGTTIAREGDTVRMGIPSKSAVEFNFEADRATVPPGATAAWYVNDWFSGSSLGWSQVFSSGQYRVELRITRPPDTAMSTPATTFETERAGVTLDLVEHSQHACQGRLGRSCSGSLPGEGRIINPVTHVGHYQIFGRIRVAAEVSVGAIRHDACCAKRGWKFGHMCKLPQVNVSPTERACEAEWEEAKDDWKRGLTWLGEWVYQGERVVSSRTLAPLGALLPDKPGNAKYCESGRAESSGRDGIIRCSGQIPIPPWAEDSRTPSPDGLHVVQWTKADGTTVTNIQTGRTTRIPFERFPRRILTPHVEGQWWFSYWDAAFKWAESGRRFAFTRCSVDWDKPPCAVFLYDLDLGGPPEMVDEELVVGAHNGPGPIGFADKKLIFRGSGEVYTIYEYDLAMRRYRPLVNGAVGGTELSPDRNRIAYFAGDDLLVFHLGTESSSIVVQKVSSLSGMSEDSRVWTVAWRSPNQLEFMNFNDSGQTRREVDVTGTKLRQRR